jgi:hypothetical protein
VGGGLNSENLIIRNTGDESININSGSSWVNDTKGATKYATNNTTLLYGAIYNPKTNLISYVNGSTIKTTTGSTSRAQQNTANYIAANPTGGLPAMSGCISEIIVFNVAQTDLQRQGVEGYLAWKWGLQAKLPALHLYKTVAPSFNQWTPISSVPSEIVKSSSSDPTELPTHPSSNFINTSSGTLYSAAPILPTEIAGCQLWLDSVDSSTLSLTGTAVNSWADKSGKGYHATPTLNGGSITYTKGTPGVNIAPQNTSGITFMTSPIPANTFNSALYIFAVYKNTGYNSLNCLISRTPSNAWQGPLDIFNKARAFNGSNAGTTSSYDLYNPSMSVFTLGVNYAGDTIDEWSNGSANTITKQQTLNPSNGDSNSANLLFIGSRGDRYTNFTGFFYEIIVYNVGLSNVDRQKIEGYLAWKWNLRTFLPSNHPYFITPPLRWNPLVNGNEPNVYSGPSGSEPLTPRINDYYINTSSRVISQKTSGSFIPVTTLGNIITNSSSLPASPIDGTYHINTVTGQILQYSSDQWTAVLGGSRILGNTSYTDALLTTTIDTGATAIYEVGPVTTSANSTLFIVANLSLFAASATTIQLTVGRHTASGATSTVSINVPSGTSQVILPYTTGASYFMASGTTTANNEAINLNGTATDTPGNGTFYYTLWVSSSASNVPNSTLTASLSIINM